MADSGSIPFGIPEKHALNTHLPGLMHAQLSGEHHAPRDLTIRPHPGPLYNPQTLVHARRTRESGEAAGRNRKKRQR
jgi:hypothetical protein